MSSPNNYNRTTDDGIEYYNLIFDSNPRPLKCQHPNCNKLVCFRHTYKHKYYWFCPEHDIRNNTNIYDIDHDNETPQQK